MNCLPLFRHISLFLLTCHSTGDLYIFSKGKVEKTTFFFFQNFSFLLNLYPHASTYECRHSDSLKKVFFKLASFMYFHNTRMARGTPQLWSCFSKLTVDWVTCYLWDDVQSIQYHSLLVKRRFKIKFFLMLDSYKTRLYSASLLVSDLLLMCSW